jgi:hypothetical protein
MTPKQLEEAQVMGRKIISREENFLGTGWWFITAIGGNYWYHRPSGKIVSASSTWVREN